MVYCSYPVSRGRLPLHLESYRALPLNLFLEKQVEQLDDRNEYQPESQVKTGISDRALILLPFYCLFRQMTMKAIDSQQDGNLQILWQRRICSHAGADWSKFNPHFSSNLKLNVGIRQAPMKVSLCGNEITRRFCFLPLILSFPLFLGISQSD